MQENLFGLLMLFPQVVQIMSLSSLTGDLFQHDWENEAATLIKYGFQFLLMETNAQLWYIVGEYISSSEDCGVDPTDLISFLLELSFHTMGKWVILDQVQKRRDHLRYRNDESQD
ncbi:RNA polymerase II transcription factor B subunit 2-like isoform X1 [Asparagus officinalis]|uniref:RNA polymerase II transcription factor B subunit 2-like isoform X1 n=1 Tax=Asparagus officinalis TaxID=4686 RepID=UPI00098E422C|nr:RNA polymerase II transcription factor B subunit 2-like isoform X1 [Asparagus officinalis]